MDKILPGLPGTDSPANIAEEYAQFDRNGSRGGTVTSLSPLVHWAAFAGAAFLAVVSIATPAHVLFFAAFVLAIVGVVLMAKHRRGPDLALQRSQVPLRGRDQQR